MADQFPIYRKWNNFLKFKEAKEAYIIHQYKIRKPPKQMTNNYKINLTSKMLLMLWILEIKHQEFNQQKVLEARLNAWLQQKKIKLAPAVERKKTLHST